MELQKESVCFKANEGCRAVEKKGGCRERKKVGGDGRDEIVLGEKMKPETAEENGRNDGEIICRDDQD